MARPGTANMTNTNAKVKSVLASIFTARSLSEALRLLMYLLKPFVDII
jgi:hypothetical protein